MGRDGPRTAVRDRQRRRAARRRGRWAEWLCVWLLRLKGYEILARGHSLGRGRGVGEVDIIARRGGVCVFIEVKARTSLAAAAQAISAAQRRRLTRAAAAYLARHPDLARCDIRFDAMLVQPWRWPCHLIDAWRDQA